MNNFFVDYILKLVEKKKIHYETAAEMLNNMDDDTMSQLHGQGGENKAAVTYDIAVIGLALRFPGASEIDGFWDILKSGTSSIGEIPQSRWCMEGFFDPERKNPGTSYSKWGGFIENVDMFDPGFFGIDQHEAKYIDPQQRVFLEVAYEAFEMAGYPKRKLWNSNTGVFVGNRAGFYKSPLGESVKAGITGNMANFIPARVSNFLSLKGPSINIDTACSSSLVAVHLACRSIIAGECEMALAGGINLKTSPYPYVTLSAAGALAQGDRSYVFDRRADGFVPGEGAGAVILKPLERALKDGDIIYGVIKGSAVNNDGHTMGATSPNMEGQKDVIARACKASGISPEEISYIETHGTGTAIGDPMEAKALKEVFAKHTSAKSFCALGSVKANIGHLDTAAGMASLIKVLLCLKNNKLPPTINCDLPNSRFDYADSPFYINYYLSDWKSAGRRIAGISTFGFGGTNCHMIVAEAPREEAKKEISDSGERMFVLSAHTEKSFYAMADKYKKYIEKSTRDDFAAICKLSFDTRDHFKHRLAVVASSPEELAGKLEKINTMNENQHQPLVFKAHLKKKSVKPPVLVFPGRGTDLNMDFKVLMHENSVFRKTIYECDEVLNGCLEKPLSHYLLSDMPGGIGMLDARIMQPLTFAIDYALAKMWMSLGIKPPAVIGHGDGEYPAACIAGMISLEDGLKLMAKKGRLLSGLGHNGAMAEVSGSIVRIMPKLDELPDGQKRLVSVAEVNSNRSTVISGREDVVGSVLEKLNEFGIESRKLQVPYAFHSVLMQPVVDEFRYELEGVRFKKAEIPFMSSFSCSMLHEIDAEYLTRQMLEPVQFMKSIQKLGQMGLGLFLETGASMALSESIAEILGNECTAIPSVKKGTAGTQSLWEARAKLFTLGVDMPVYGLDAEGREYKNLVLPTYEFDRSRHWIEQNRFVEQETASGPNRKRDDHDLRHPLITGCLEASHHKAIYYKDITQSDSFIAHHVVLGAPLAAGMVWLEASRYAVQDFSGEQTVAFEDISFLNPFYMGENRECRVEIVIERAGTGRYEFNVRRELEGTQSHEGAIYVKGTALTANAGHEHKGSFETVEGPFAKTIEGGTVYNSYNSDIGIVYGSYYKGVRKVRVTPDNNAVLTELEVENSEKYTSEGYYLHPGMLDSAMQGLIGTVMDESGAISDSTAFVPLFMKYIGINGPVMGKCYAHASISKKNPEFIRYNLCITDLNGKPLLGITDASAKRVPYTDFAQQLQKPVHQNAIPPEPTVDSHALKPDVQPVPDYLPEDLPGDDNALVHRYMTGLVRGLVASALGDVGADGLDWEDSTFVELGMDSGLLVGLTDSLERKMGVKLNPTVFFEFQTINQLSEYLANEFGQKMLPAIMQKANTQSLKNGNIQNAVPSGHKSSAYTEAFVINTKTTIEDNSRDMAIIGYSLRLPGANTEQEFWSNMVNGVDSITEVPKDRWDIDAMYSSTPGESGKTYCRYGGFVSNIDKFDSLFFNISPKEAQVLDPKQRLVCEVAWEALEHAGYAGNKLPKKTGVFMGTSYNNYYENLPEAENENPFTGAGNGNPVMANRLSHYLNLSGPSMVVDTYCSSSLVALHLACTSIISGDCEAAIVGGAHMLAPNHYAAMGQVQALSYTGKCRTFDQSADGYVPGEGAVAVIIKPLYKALQDGDTVHAVIKSTAVNHCGHSNNLTSPNAVAQGEVVAQAYEKCGINPETVTYIEAHGTGTSLGDPVEIKGLMNGFSRHTTKKNYCAIGSVKTNIGHLEPASGLAGLLKVVLSLKNGIIPPSLNFDKPNKFIDFSSSPFYVNDRPLAWSRDKGQRRAAVSAFGLTGTNAHVIIEEAPDVKTPAQDSLPHILCLSARSENALKEQILKYKDFLSKGTVTSLKRISYTALTGRMHFPYRFSVVVNSKESLRDKLILARFIMESEDEALENAGMNMSVSGTKSLPVFVFAAQVMHDADFKELSIMPGFNAAVQKAHSLYRSLKGGNTGFEGEVTAAPYMSFVLQYALASLLKNLGIKPDVLIGKGVGKIAAAVLADVLSLEHALKFIIDLEKAMDEGTPYARMFLEIPNRYSIKPASIPLANELDGTIIKDGIPGHDFWYTGTDKDLNGRILDSMLSVDSMAYLESMMSSRKRCLVYIGGRRREQDGQHGIELHCDDMYNRVSVLKAVAVLYSKGVNIAGEKLFGDENIQKAQLPTYPFQKSSYWLQEYGRTAALNGETVPGVPKEAEAQVKVIHTQEDAPDGKLVFPVRTFVPEELPQTAGGLNGNVYVVLNHALGVAEKLADRLSRMGNSAVIVQKGQIYSRIDRFNYIIRPYEQEDYSVLFCSIQEDFGKLTGVIDLFACYSDSTCFQDIGTLTEGLYKGSCYMFIMAKALISSFKGKKPSITVITTDALYHASGDVFAETGSSTAIEKAPLTALLKVIGNETGTAVKLVDFESGSIDAQRISNAVVNELSSEGESVEVAYRGGSRFVARLCSKEITHNSPKKLLLKDNGVYLVVGGSTGAGLITSRYLAQKGKINLIITGRTELPAKDKWSTYVNENGNGGNADRIRSLLELEKMGAAVEYYCADVCDLSSMHKVVNHAVEKFGPINGVIHSGGVKDDALIVNKSFDEFLKVLAPKTLGTYILDRVTADQPLDFFVMYSSFSALTGNPGQSDYASANAFMDAFARSMRAANGRKYLSINWSYWNEGGMKMPAAAFNSMKSMGILPLETEDAMRALETCLANVDSITNAGVLKQVRTERVKPEPKMDSPQKPETVKKVKTAVKVLEDYLLKVLKELLLLRDDQLNPSLRFDEYGVDSLMLQKCIQELEKFLDRSVEPAAFFEYPTITLMAEYLAGYQPDTPAEGGIPLHGETDVLPVDVPQVGVPQALHFTHEPNTIAVVPDTQEIPQYKEASEGIYNTASTCDSQSDDIAIIGIAVKFPGADSIGQFWENLCKSVCSIKHVPEERWNIDEVIKRYGVDAENKNSIFSPMGGYIDDIDQFDAQFFGIAENEAPYIDPQHRLLLETVWNALEHAGYTGDKIWGSDTGVYIGARGFVYKSVIDTSTNDLVRAGLTGSLGNFTSARISDFFNMKGPSVTLDTACSSSLVSTHYACKSILRGECDIAVSCGAEIKSGPEMVIGLKAAKAISPDDRSYVFDRRANGFVPGEGVGAVVLKALKKAIRDGDTVYAVIKGSAINNDGRTMGITTPDLDGQQGVIEKALNDAKIDPSTISYIEAHGTGTMIGDPIEIKALTRAYEKYSLRKAYCAIGSVKTNIGHLDTAAGIASIIKVALALYNKKIPATLNIEMPNHRFKFIDSPFYPAAFLEDWKPVNRVRRAGISSFGFGGTNCHMILEEAPAEKARENAADRSHQVFMLSAKSGHALQTLALEYAKHMEANPGLYLGDLCFTAGTSRSMFDNRLAVVCSSTQELSEKLKAGDFVSGSVRPMSSPQIVFMFTGQGAQYPGMAKALYQNQPVFRHQLDRVSDMLEKYLGKSVVDIIYSSNENEMKETAITQPVTFAIDYSLASMWMSWGIKPSAVMGHSVGEYVAACIAGVFSLEDGVKLIYHRSRLMHEKCPKGAMAAVMAGEDKVNGYFDRIDAHQRKGISIGAYNGPANTVVAGEEDTVTKVIQMAGNDGIRCVRLAVSHGFHSPLMEPALDEFSRVLDTVNINENTIPLISNVTGEKVENSILDKQYWLKHIMEPVKFYQSIKRCEDGGHRILLEVGPGNTLSGMAKGFADPGNVSILSTLTRGKPDWQSVQEAMAQMFAIGVKIDYQAYDGGFERKKTALPQYPFNRKSYWIDQTHHAGDMNPKGIPGGKASGPHCPKCFDRCEEISMEKAVYTKELRKDMPLLADHAVLGSPALAGVCCWDMVLQAAKASLGRNDIVLQEIVQKSLIKVDTGSNVTARVVIERTERGYSFRLLSMASGVWVENCTGKLAFDTPQKADALEASLDVSRDVSPLLKSMDGIFDEAGIYRDFSAIGLSYGPAFRSIKQIRTRGMESIALLDLPHNAKQFDHMFEFNPSLVDGALQSVIGIMKNAGGSGIEAFVPFFTERVEFLKPLTPRCYGYLMLDGLSGSGEIIKSNVEILDEKGEVCITVKGFCLKKAPVQKAMERAANTPVHQSLEEVYLSKPVWKEKALSNAFASETPNHGTAIFMDYSSEHEMIAQRISGEGGNVLRVYPGTGFRKVSEGKYEIGLGRSEDYAALFNMFKESGKTYAKIIHLWSLSRDREPPASVEELEETQYRGAYSLYFIIKELLAAKLGYKVKVTVLANNSLPFVGSLLMPEKSTIYGFARVINMESRDIRFKCIDIDADEQVDAYHVLKSESYDSSDDSGDEAVVYRKGKRWIRDVGELEFRNAYEDIRFRDGGVYVVTGGLGGVGLEIARYIALNYKACVAIIGRSYLPEPGQFDSFKNDQGMVKKIEAIREMEARGSKVQYFMGDVSDYVSMSECISKIEAAFGGIDGVIHSAGVLRDALTVNQTFEAVKDVFAPKVRGAWILDSLLSNKKPAFMILFSGMVSVFPNIGQSAYTAANTYLDAFAHYRQQMRGLRTIAINWWFWGETGMAATRRMVENLKNRGLDPISTEQGIKAFMNVLGTGEVQVLVHKIDGLQKSENTINASTREAAGTHTAIKIPFDEAAVAVSPLGPESASKRIEISKTSVQDGVPSAKKLASWVKEYVAHRISGIAGRSIDTSAFTSAFLELGVDSVGLVNLAAELEKKASVSLYPTLFFEYNNIDKLGDFLAHEYKQEFEKFYMDTCSKAAESARHIPAAVRVEDTAQVYAAPVIEREPAAPQHVHVKDETPVNSVTAQRDEKPDRALAPDTASVASDIFEDQAQPGEGMMRGVFIKGPGRLSNLVVKNTDIPEIKPDEVLVRVRAAGVNFSDMLTVMGNYPNALSTYPYILGNEVSGVVEKVGKEVRAFKPGQEVIGLTKGFGGFAEYVAVDQATLWLKPGYLSHEEAAALPTVFLTAYHALYYLGKIQEGEKILIRGAAGGVGLAAINLAKSAGAVIIGAAGSDDKVGYLKSIGVDYPFNYKSKDTKEFIMELTGGKGVDIILSSSAGNEVAGLMELLAPNGRMLEMGMAGIRRAPALDLNLFVENQSLFGIDLKRLRSDIMKKHVQSMDNMLKNRSLKPINVKAFEYTRSREAIQYMGLRKNIGKVVITFSDRNVNMSDKPKASNEISGVAIIGISGHFPGAETPEQFWKNLVDGKDCVTHYPAERKELVGLDGGYDCSGFSGGFIKDIEMFDPLFFNISPAEAIVMDPQQRMFLMAAWEAVEDAGYGSAGSLPEDTGVYVGVSRRDYVSLIKECPKQSAGFSVTGNIHSILASRLSYFLNLKGPAIAVDTACSSALVAIHMACESILKGECSMAFAGGVNLLIKPENANAFAVMNALSDEARCKAFDRSADGFVCAEGAGVFVLKPLEAAMKDGDNIYAVIKGTALNNDGFSNGITAPNPAAQTDVILKALEKSGIDPGTISYIEAHGTGTLLGDPIEIEGLTKVYEGVLNKSGCPIGSVKTNIGHAETAAGAASLLKVVMAMKHKKLPPSIHFNSVNPMLKIEKTPFYVNNKLADWDDQLMRTGISSFGFSGTNAHIIVEAPPIPGERAYGQITGNEPFIFVLSAMNEKALKEYAEAVKERLLQDDGLYTGDVCFTAALGKKHMGHRLAMVVNTNRDIADGLEKFVSGKEGYYSYPTKESSSGRVKKTAFYFASAAEKPGEFKAYEGEKAFVSALEECRNILDELGKTVYGSDAEGCIKQYAAAKTLESWGIIPAFIAGEGKGILMALAFSGRITLRDAIALMTGASNRLENLFDERYPVVSVSVDRVVEDMDSLLGLVDTPTVHPELSGVLACYMTSNNTPNIIMFGGNAPFESSINKSGTHIEIVYGLGMDRKKLLGFIASIYSRGGHIEWKEVYGKGEFRRISLPAYPFQKKKYWVDVKTPALSKPADTLNGGGSIPTRQAAFENETLRSQSEVDDGNHGYADRAAEFEHEILYRVKELIAQLLIMDMESLDENTDFGDYGIDSMLIKQAVSMFEKEFDMTVESGIFLEYPNVAALAGYFAERIPIKSAVAPGKIDTNNPAQTVHKDESSGTQGVGLLDRLLDELSAGNISIDSAYGQIMS